LLLAEVSDSHSMTIVDRLAARVLLVGITLPGALWYGPPETTSIPPAADESRRWQRDVSAEPLFDVYGNEIDIAVGEYRVDARGRVYESHAPDIGSAILLPPRS